MRTLRCLLHCCLPLVVVAVLVWLWWPRQPTSSPGQDGPIGPPWFADVTDEVGLRFTHDAGPVGNYFMPQALGSGAALFDCDGDGRLDVYLVHNGGPRGARNQLFRQGKDGRFTDVSAGSGLDVAGYGMGVATGDVNNDGRPDLLLTEHGRVRLFLNLGDGKFADVTRQASLSNPAWGTSAAFFDYDRDGWLDVVVVNYVDYDPTWPCTSPSGRPEYCAPRTFPGRVTKLFRNRGAPTDHASRPMPRTVQFDDVTVASGLGRLAGPGLGVLCEDFDGDGRPDIFVANDGEANRLWINRGDGTFVEEAIARGAAYNRVGQAEAGMGVAAGDVDGDGLFDLFVTHLTEERHTLWRQHPRGTFTDATVRFGLAHTEWRGTGFGTIMGDFDHDGALDIAVVNGRIARAAVQANPDLGPHWSWYAERNQLFAGNGRGRFRDISRDNRAFCGTPNVARGLACGDVDGDGALDLLVTTAGGRARLYRNTAQRRGHWLLVRALDPALKRDAHGAQVIVRAGGRAWRRQVNPNTSYLCSNDARGHFGLGGAARIDAIEVLWPDGTAEQFPGCRADQSIILRKGEGKAVPRPRPGKERS